LVVEVHVVDYFVCAKKNAKKVLHVQKLARKYFFTKRFCEKKLLQPTCPKAEI